MALHNLVFLPVDSTSLLLDMYSKQEHFIVCIGKSTEKQLKGSK